MAGGPGIVFGVPHFPGRAPIDAYGNGGFRFADMSHRGSILCLPSGIHAWDCDDGLDAAAFSRILAEAASIDILLIGTGVDIRPVDDELRRRLRAEAIAVDAMSTGAAVRTYNVLVAEERAVAAALRAVA